MVKKCFSLVTWVMGHVRSRPTVTDELLGKDRIERRWRRDADAEEASNNKAASSSGSRVVVDGFIVDAGVAMVCRPDGAGRRLRSRVHFRVTGRRASDVRRTPDAGNPALGNQFRPRF